MKKLFLVVILISLLSACGAERNARGAAEDYMDAVKNGDEYENVSYGIDGFIDVFDYEYLQTLDETEEKRTRTVSYEDWEMLYGDEEDPAIASYEEYKDKEIREGDQIISDDGDTVVFWDGESYFKKYVFLYNVEIANELGQKVFKKAEITVEESPVWKNEDRKELIDGYEITDIYIR